MPRDRGERLALMSELTWHEEFLGLSDEDSAYLLIRSLLALGASTRDLVRAISGQPLARAR